ncbi:MAG: hypothetical protein Q7J05_08210 [Paludibacter sp.]|nr:hypothetical protein [Paludibacter sp.]
MKFTTSNKRLFSLLMIGIGIGLAIPLIYHKVTGGTLLGLGIIAESIGFPIVFAIASCLIECLISKCVQQESILETSLIDSTLQNTIINEEQKTKAKKLVKPNVVIHVGSGEMVIEDSNDDNNDIVTTRSANLPISSKPRADHYGDDTLLYIMPTMTLTTQVSDDDILSSDPKMQNTRMPLLQRTSS